MKNEPLKKRILIYFPIMNREKITIQKLIQGGFSLNKYEFICPFDPNEVARTISKNNDFILAITDADIERNYHARPQILTIWVETGGLFEDIIHFTKRLLRELREKNKKLKKILEEGK